MKKEVNRVLDMGEGKEFESFLFLFFNTYNHPFWTQMIIPHIIDIFLKSRKGKRA